MAGITVHNFEGTPPSEVYDRTQTDDSIKDGDVLNLGNGNVAILMKAWPTIVAGEIEHFHRLATGVTFESVDDGKYAGAAAKAREVASMTKLRLRVFGSRASGENRENSDIDVLIEGPVGDIELAKKALREYSIEEGGPLDLFVIGSVDNPVDLIAAYAPKDAPRTVGVGGAEDLDDVLSSAYDITLESLLKLCEKVDEAWNETTSADKIRAKRRM